MGLIAWLVVGAIAGYIAGMLVRGDERLGVAGHVGLGIVGAIVGGLVAGVITGGDYIGGITIPTFLLAVVGAGATVVVWKAVAGSTPSGGRMA